MLDGVTKQGPSSDLRGVSRKSFMASYELQIQNLNLLLDATSTSRIKDLCQVASRCTGGVGELGLLKVLKVLQVCDLDMATFDVPLASSEPTAARILSFVPSSATAVARSDPSANFLSSLS